jgi:hypothetical protein
MTIELSDEESGFSQDQASAKKLVKEFVLTTLRRTGQEEQLGTASATRARELALGYKSRLNIIKSSTVGRTEALQKLVAAIKSCSAKFITRPAEFVPLITEIEGLLTQAASIKTPEATEAAKPTALDDLVKTIDEICADLTKASNYKNALRNLLVDEAFTYLRQLYNQVNSATQPKQYKKDGVDQRLIAALNKILPHALYAMTLDYDEYDDADIIQEQGVARLFTRECIAHTLRKAKQGTVFNAAIKARADDFMAVFNNTFDSIKNKTTGWGGSTTVAKKKGELAALVGEIQARGAKFPNQPKDFSALIQDIQQEHDKI